MSATTLDDVDEEGSNELLDGGRDDAGVADDSERSTIILSTCDEDLFENDRDDVTLAESIIRTRTSVYRVSELATSSLTSTEPISSTEFEESSRNESTSDSHGTSHSNRREGNSLSGSTARLSDDASADSLRTSIEKSENANRRSENVVLGKEMGNQITLRWSTTENPLPTLPKDILQAHATQFVLPPLERRTTVSTLSTGPSNRTGDISAELDDEGMTPIVEVPVPTMPSIVAVPVPTSTAAVDAVTVLILENAGPSAVKRRKKTLFICLMAVIVVSVLVVVAGVCGSGRCAKDRSPNREDVPPPSPSLAKLDDRTIALYSYINNVTFGRSLSPYENDTTPERQALNWLIESDPLQLVPQNSSFRIRQRYALLSFWFHSKNTIKWANSTGWLDYDDECTWFGISCSNINHGPDTGVQRTVTVVDFGINGISGIIPSDLGLLSNLQYFGLESNLLYGSIPSSIGRWTDLEHLYLQLQNGEKLTGQIPESIGKLHRLLFADFSYNSFTGELPSSIGNWTDLVHIDFSGLHLNSTIPSSVGNWKNVEFVSFMSLGGHMHGTLPVEVIGKWRNLRKLSLAGNEFSGTLPPTIAYWTNLRVIDVSFNAFSGSIPGGVANWTSIEEMYIFRTALTGDVPDGGCMFSNLTKLEANCANVSCSCCTLCV
jgi:hypothetical protein